MARDGSGVYSKPPNTTAIADTVIDPDDFNALVDDFVDDLNAPRPVVAGGTGATAVAQARANLGLTIGSDVQAWGATLDVVSSLTPAADRLPYFTGVSGAALATFTSAARDLLDDADSTAMRGTLGVYSTTETDSAISAATTSIEGGGGVRAPLFEGTATAFPTSGNSVTETHGLGRVPYHVEAVAVCTVATSGYSVGDEIILNTGSDDPHASSLWRNATAVGYTVSGTISTTSKASATRFSFAAANWDVVLRAW